LFFFIINLCKTKTNLLIQIFTTREMKKELDTKKPTKPAVIPLKENDKNEMKKRIDEINSKLKEKQTNVQRIVKEY